MWKSIALRVVNWVCFNAFANLDAFISQNAQKAWNTGTAQQTRKKFQYLQHHI
jgi:hypothetical protein